MNIEIDISNVFLKTERLNLRPFQQSDLEDFYAYASVPGVGEMAGWRHHNSLDESRFMLAMMIAGGMTLALSLGGRIIGHLTIAKYDEDVLPELREDRVFELGFVLSKDYWGQGLMKEACEVVIGHLFEEEGADIIVCGCYTDNLQSARLQEKLGFKRYKLIRCADRLGNEREAWISLFRRGDWLKSLEAICYNMNIQTGESV